MNWATITTAVLFIVFGVALLLAGYRLFRALIPIWGFLVGFGLVVGLGGGVFQRDPLSSLGGWIVAILVGLLVAVLAYAYYYIAVVALGISVGYQFAAGLAASMFGITGSGAVVAGLVGAVVVASIIIMWNLPRALLIVLTSLAGASAVLTGGLLLFGQTTVDTLPRALTGGAIAWDWWLTVLYVVIAALGIYLQARLEWPALPARWSAPPRRLSSV